MNIVRAFFFVAFLFLFTTSPLVQAQGKYGRIQGTVKDSLTKEALFGANIWLEGTSLGVATGIEGEYKITQIQPGSYNLIVRYIGYEQKKFAIEIKEDKTLQIDVSLLSKAIEGREIIVTAQARGQKDAINQQLSSGSIKNIVSSERIHELPDGNASTALSRLPGLSLMNGDKIVVRGIQSKMNVILVNGVQLPSTDVNDRSTNLGFISSNMLSGIEVVKAVTPDMDANAIGGVVNLRLREAPADLHVDMLAQGSYNTQDHTSDNYKFWASVSNRFFDNNFGVFVQANADRSNEGSDAAGASFAKMGTGGDLSYGQATYGMNSFTYSDQVNIYKTYGGSVILDYVLPQGKIILQNTITQANYDLANYRDQLDFVNTQRIYTVQRDINSKKLIINALQSEYTLGDVKVELGLSHSYSNKDTDLRYGDPGENFGFKNQVSSIPSFAYMNEAKKLTLTMDDIYNLNLNPDDWKVATIYAWAGTRSEAFTQHLYNANLDFTIPISFSNDFSAKFKLGGKITSSSRSNDLERYYCRITEPQNNKGAADFLTSIGADPNKILQYKDFMNYDYERGTYYLDGLHNMQNVIDLDRLDEFMRLAPPKWVPGRHFTDSKRYDFDGKETFNAGYVMGDFNIGSQLNVTAGVRFEHFNMDYDANFVFVTHSVDGNGVLKDTLHTVNRNDDQLFPNVQMRYKFSDWCDLRLAYTQTISRPDYTAMMPNIYVGDPNSGQAGNTKLKPTTSKNFDAYLSFYNNEIGLFTVGGFYKKLTDIFYSTTIFYQNLSYYNATFPDSATFKALKLPYEAVGAQISTYINNPYPAYIRGFELDWQTNFWYLPEPFNSLVLNINYTKVWSDMDYQQIRNNNVSYSYVDPITGRTKYGTKYVTVDTLRNARLLYQGDNILNVALGVDYKGFSGRISFNMQGNVITGIGSRPEEDSFTGTIYKWDFTLQQKLPIDGLSLSFSGTNIFHNPVKNYQDFRRTATGDILQNETNISYSPRKFELNLRYNM